MTIEQIIKQNCSDNEKLGMILSYHMNYMINGDGAITIKVWDKLVSDLISWKNTPENTSSNSDYAKCKIEAEIKRLEENPEGDYVTRISALEWALRIITGS